MFQRGHNGCFGRYEETGRNVPEGCMRVDGYCLMARIMIALAVALVHALIFER